MSLEDKSSIYSEHKKFVDKILIKKRKEIIELINLFLQDKNFYDVLDVGTTKNLNHQSSNIIIKNIKTFKTYKSISNQKIISNFFSHKLTKSITDNFDNIELEKFKSDLVISNATIEHVGNLDNQIKMCKNISLLSKKYFIIITPNRYHPFEFHTKLPLIHWFLKVHRFILNILGFKMLSKEELKFIIKKDLINIMGKVGISKHKISYINFLFFKSNLVLIGKKN